MLDRDRPMKSFILPVTCPECESEVGPVNIGESVDGGRNVSAVVRCTQRGCNKEWAIHIYMMEMGVYTDEGLTHGTNMGATRHRNLGEELCQECLDFIQRRVQDNKRRSRQGQLTPV